MNILAFESSCDETSAAVVTREDGKFHIKSNIIASQIETHRLYGGVVPEIASRAHAEVISKITYEALDEAKLTLADWRRDMPMVSRRSRSVPISPAQTGRVLRAMARREQHVEFGGGMRIRRKDGWAWICPDEARPRLRIVTEAASEEYARELCDFCETELKRIAAEKN